MNFLKNILPNKLKQIILKVLNEHNHPKLQLFKYYINKKYLTGNGLEIGPGDFPFSTSKNTIMLDKYTESRKNQYKYLSGDADDIPVNDSEFDFLVTAHCIEHCINSIKTINEFIRVTKDGGIIFIMLPHCERTFDQGREISKLDKHIYDFENGVNEDDYIKKEGRYSYVMDEFLKITCDPFNHPWEKDAKNSDGTWNRKWIIDNGCFHYHVWTQDQIVSLLKYLNCKICLVIDKMPGRDDTFVVAAEVSK